MSTATPARPGLLLHLSGPLQSWGEHSRFNVRDTSSAPTRSGILGMVAAALGRPREQPLDDLSALRIAVRADRPGIRLRDFHTVGGGLPSKQTVMTAEGKRRPGDTGTLVSERYYLQDAAFTISLSLAPEETDASLPGGLLDECATALASPRWPLFLGRRSCPPSGPLLLGPSTDVWHDLTHLPLHAKRGRNDRIVDFQADEPLDGLPLPTGCAVKGKPRGTSLNDDPVCFASDDRRYRSRNVHMVSVTVPAQATACYGGLGTDYIRAVNAYLRGPADGTTGEAASAEPR